MEHAPEPSPRERRLRNLPLVFGIVVAAGAILLWGELNSPHPYAHPDFVVDYFLTEVLTAVFLLVVTVALFPARSLGWKVPTLASVPQILPSVLLVAAALGLWAFARTALPPDVPADPARPWLVLRTTVLVGINEEWMFRGFVLATLCARLGLRKGAILAAVAFGLFHTMNVAAGQSPALALVQAASTLLIGTVFVHAALATRSLVWPAAAHAVYDFAVIEIGRLTGAGAPVWLPIATTGTAWLLGLAGLVMLFRLRDGSPFGDD